MRFLLSETAASDSHIGYNLNQRISSFWQQLAKLATLKLRDVAQHLAEIDADLSVEACRTDERLVLRADDRSLRPRIHYLLEQAPPELRPRFLALRPAYELTVLAQAPSKLLAGLQNAKVRAGFARGHLLDVIVYVPGGKGSSDEQDAAIDALELLIGESDFDDWIGEITAAPAPRGGALRVLSERTELDNAFAIGELPGACHAAIRALYASLPDAPRWKLSCADAWTLFELDPELADDFAAQDDLSHATTSEPEMLKSFLRGDAFASRRFSRHAEVFAYLKLDAEGSPLEAVLEKRKLLEDALNVALMNEQLGCVVGNGLGLRYAYIDLALSPEQRAFSLTQEVARAHGVAQRSWIQFCDSDYAREWLPVWQGAPPPPGV